MTPPSSALGTTAAPIAPPIAPPIVAEGAARDTAVGPKPVTAGRRQWAAQLAVFAFVLIPLLAVVAAVPFAWGWGLSWTDIAIAAVFYVISGMGITVGFHRHFTHGAFKANRALRYALAAAGQMAVQGPVIIWVADHRRHHAFSDREGDPHSPWLYGTSVGALAKGFWHAHMGWLFDRDTTNQQRFAPDLLADKDICRVNKLFWVWTMVSLFAPAVVGGLVTLVLGRRADRVLLGRPGPGRAAAPRDLVGQLDLPHDRRAAVRRPRPVGQLLAAGAAELRRVLAQPAPRRSDLRPARGAARAARHLRPGDLAVREVRLGHQGPLAVQPAAGPHPGDRRRDGSLSRSRRTAAAAPWALRRWMHPARDAFRESCEDL